jgi:hypothetical protein
MLSKYLEPQAVVNEQYPQNDESKKKRKIRSNSLGNHLSRPQQQWRRREKAIEISQFSGKLHLSSLSG